MSNLTALQQAMRIVEQYAPQLFDTYNANGRTFIDEMTKLLDVEREQAREHYIAGFNERDDMNAKLWVNPLAREYNDKRFQEYYNETYKGGEQ